MSILHSCDINIVEAVDTLQRNTMEARALRSSSALVRVHRNQRYQPATRASPRVELQIDSSRDPRAAERRISWQTESSSDGESRRSTIQALSLAAAAAASASLAVCLPAHALPELVRQQPIYEVAAAARQAWLSFPAAPLLI